MAALIPTEMPKLCKINLHEAPDLTAGGAVIPKDVGSLPCHLLSSKFGQQKAQKQWVLKSLCGQGAGTA